MTDDLLEEITGAMAWGDEESCAECCMGGREEAMRNILKNLEDAGFEVVRRG